jgi:hypothetical protein
MDKVGTLLDVACHDLLNLAEISLAVFPCSLPLAQLKSEL